MFLWWCLMFAGQVNGFWELATTTVGAPFEDVTPRQSFFRWQIFHTERYAWWFSNWDWYTIHMNKRLACICGLSIDFLPLSTGTLLNARTLVSSANPLEPYMARQKDLRIWALGREGIHTTPYRYRVWRVRRILPKSLNPEHWHGPRGVHVMRHDVTVIHSFDKMYIYSSRTTRFIYPQYALLGHKHELLVQDLWFAGSGFEYLTHITENYKIFWANQTKDDIVDCSKYLPKWWGKFICITNTHGYAGVPNGGGLFNKADPDDRLIGLGCFEIRYNEDRIMVFTDLRYYMDIIENFCNVSYGEYYEYAYPQWSIVTRFLGLWDDMSNTPYIPEWHAQDMEKPYGRRRK